MKLVNTIRFCWDACNSGISTEGGVFILKAFMCDTKIKDIKVAPPDNDGLVVILAATLNAICTCG